MSSAFRVSLAANIVLLVLVAVLLLRRQSAAPSPVPSPTLRSDVSSVKPQAEPLRDVSPPKSSGTGLTRDAIAQLERRGVSRETLTNVLLNELNQRSTQRVAALQKKYAPRLVPDREMLELSRQIDGERIRAIKEAFGEEGYRAWDKEQTLHELNSARPPGDELRLSPEEAEQAYRLQKDFDDKAKDLQMAMEDGVADKADVGTLQAQAQRALDQELEKLLGPQRFNELRGNIDPTTEVYRKFGDFNPTPEQAQAAALAENEYRSRQDALAKKLSDNPAAAANTAAELKAINDAQEENLRRIFGPEAYENMKRQSDPTYKTLQQYAEAWDLKGPEVQSVYDSLHSFDDQASRIRTAAEMSEAAGQHVNWREVNAGIEQARRQTEAGLQNLIGGERLHRLEQNGLLSP
jgi:hypothetical protein